MMPEQSRPAVHEGLTELLAMRLEMFKTVTRYGVTVLFTAMAAWLLFALLRVLFGRG